MSAADRRLSALLLELDADRTVTVVGRCPQARCKARLRLEVGRVTELPAGKGNPPEPDRFPETAAMSSWVGTVFALKHFPPASCREHQRDLVFAGLVADHRPDVTCSSSCTDASSPECRCSCAGANHGIHAR